MYLIHGEEEKGNEELCSSTLLKYVHALHYLPHTKVKNDGYRTSFSKPKTFSQGGMILYLQYTSTQVHLQISQ